MVDMARPGKGNQQIDIKEIGHQGSSSARRTSSGVMGLAPGGTTKMGNPFRDCNGLPDSRPLRTSSLSTEPMDVERVLAMLRTAAKMSSSILRVVRIAHKAYVCASVMSRCYSIMML